MYYYRLTKGIQDKGILIPATQDLTQVYKTLKPKQDYYLSIFKFNEIQKTKFDETGSVAGMTDVLSDRLVWDFDNAEKPELAREDAIELVSRLKKEGYKDDNVRIFFSGNKGFEVSVQLQEDLTPSQMKNVCLNFAEGLKSVDRVIYNATRILRMPLTQHATSKLYKYPLTTTDLSSLNITEIKDLAKDSISYSDIKDFWQSAPLKGKLILLKDKAPEVKLNTAKASYNLDELEWGTKPRDLSYSKWLLEMGYFDNGERSHALMILASTYKGLGYDQTKSYYLLKAASDKQSDRTGDDKFPKTELWNNIIKQVYSPTWQGGTYSEKTDDLLMRLALLVPPSAATHKNDVLTISQTSGLFKEFTANLEKNILKFGIKSLDERLMAMIGRVYVIGGSPGSGKCHGKGTPIMMFDGSIRNVEDVKVGDLLMGDDSTPRTVLSLASGKEMLYNISQANGDDYVVNESHILSLKGSSTTKKQNTYGEVFDIPLKDYLNKTDDFKKSVKGYKVAVDFSKKQLEIDPYILGAWLGDGTTSKPEFTAAVCEKPLIDYINTWADSRDLHASMKEYDSGILTIRINGERQVNPFLNTLRELKLTEGKHIPHHYLTSNREDRLQLLGGLLDTDGHFDVKKGTFEFSQSNEVLMDQVVFLIRSLGFKTTKSTEMKHYKSFTKGKWYEGVSKSHRLYISGDNLNEIPTKLERKKAPAQDRQRYQDLTEIEVGPIGVGEYFGFELDGNHRYLLGDFTVTHNTSLGLQIMNNTSLQDIPSMFFSFDMGLEDVYQKLIQKHTKKQAKDVYEDSKDAAKVKEVDATLDKNYANVYFIRSSGMTVEAMKNRIIETERITGVELKLILVDYLDLVQADFSDPTQKSMAVIQGLKEIATSLRKCVVVLSQPNKANQKVNKPVESYAAIKGSGAVAELANVVLWVYRPGANPRTFEDDLYYSVDCLKNRHGAMFSVDYAWEGVSGTINELSPVQRINLQNLRARLEEDGDDDRGGF